jgi:hypothetical protein
VSETDQPIEVHPIVVPAVVRGSEVVGAKMRPDRPLTVGKRRADRVMAYALAAALLILSLTAAVTSVRAYWIDQHVTTIESRCLP